MHKLQNSVDTLPSKPRFASLDVIRGIAILGILLMNIQSFSMIGQAYLNPMAYGDMTGLNKWVWIVSHVFADQKFLSIFCILFGASIVMIAEKTEAKTGRSLKVHYSRNLWLLIIGLAHGYLFWYGDILAPYAACSFALYFFRKLPAKALIGMGIIIFSISSFIHIYEGMKVFKLPQSTLDQMSGGWTPNQRIIDKNTAAYLGSFSDQLAQRAKTLHMMQTVLFPTFYVWRISGLMLIGMALFKSGFLLGKSTSHSYKRVFIRAASIGLALVVCGLLFNFYHSWQLKYSMFFGAEFNYWGSLCIAMAYISGIILWIKSGKSARLRERFASVGRMALSNYLLQTLICTSIFYGFGLGMFGQVSRTGQLGIVVALWVLQLLISPVWLRYFQFGPMEWLWRSLTKMKAQPLLKQ
ncbi:MAG: DUF418 domain-containing protein [Roseivirga sp.]|nr:DUF418 domain-containing protein [Roseivirga sp.]